MLNAAHLKDRSATIEHARLLWKDGHHRKAIQILEGAIAANEFASTTSNPDNPNPQSAISSHENHQNLLSARVCRKPEAIHYSSIVCLIYLGTPIISEMDR